MKINTTVATIMIMVLSLIATFVAAEGTFLIRWLIITAALLSASMLGMRLQKNIHDEIVEP